jgi:hypothetical protein
LDNGRSDAQKGTDREEASAQIAGFAAEKGGARWGPLFQKSTFAHSSARLYFAEEWAG